VPHRGRRGDHLALRAGREHLLRRQPLKTAIRYANRKVLEATKEKSEYEGMATTVAAVLVDGDSANLGHVGDSRVYLMRDGEITQLTSDHSWVNEQIQSGVISPDQARTHPLRNVVTRALGGKPDLQVDMQQHKAKAGDILILCSDGLTTMIPDEDIARVCARPAATWRRRPRPWWPAPTRRAERTTSRFS
jgi:protein phosphatase